MFHRISGWIRHRIERMVHCYPTDEFHIFFCLKRKRADIRSIRSDPINPMAHHRLKKKDRIEVNLVNPVNSIWSDRSDGSSPAIRGYPRLELSEPDGVVT